MITYSTRQRLQFKLNIFKMAFNDLFLLSTLSLKRNATFWKLTFFWRRVYTIESGVIYGRSLIFDRMHISHDPGSHDPDPGPQEKSMKKSCVSFETECISRSSIFFTELWHALWPYKITLELNSTHFAQLIISYLIKPVIRRHWVLPGSLTYVPHPSHPGSSQMTS